METADTGAAASSLASSCIDEVCCGCKFVLWIAGVVVVGNEPVEGVKKARLGRPCLFVRDGRRHLHVCIDVKISS